MVTWLMTYVILVSIQGGISMAFDGLVISALTDEFSGALTGGRINKIYQPESDELILTIKNNGNNFEITEEENELIDKFSN